MKAQHDPRFPCKPSLMCTVTLPRRRISMRECEAGVIEDLFETKKKKPTLISRFQTTCEHLAACQPKAFSNRLTFHINPTWHTHTPAGGNTVRNKIKKAYMDFQIGWCRIFSKMRTLFEFSEDAYK